MVELLHGSGVYIASTKFAVALSVAKSRTHLARRLMDALWDEATLAKSSLSERSTYQYDQLNPQRIAIIACKK